MLYDGNILRNSDWETVLQANLGFVSRHKYRRARSQHFLPAFDGSAKSSQVLEVLNRLPLPIEDCQR